MKSKPVKLSKSDLSELGFQFGISESASRMNGHVDLEVEFVDKKEKERNRSWTRGTDVDAQALPDVDPWERGATVSAAAPDTNWSRSDSATTLSNSISRDSMADTSSPTTPPRMLTALSRDMMLDPAPIHNRTSQRRNFATPIIKRDPSKFKSIDW